MTLSRLARELDETARQTAALADGVTAALRVLSDAHLDGAAARKQASAIIVAALQGQDRVQQRCRNMALAVRQLALLPGDAPETLLDTVWSSLELDELRLPDPAGAQKITSGEVELF